MFKVIVITVLLYNSAVVVHGSNEIEEIIDQRQPQQEVIELNKKASANIYKDSIAARQYAEKAIALSEEIDYEEGKAKAYKYLGLLSLLQGRLEKSKAYYQYNLDYQLKRDDPILQAKAYLTLTEATKRLGEKVVTLDHLLKALRLIEETEDSKTLTKILDGLGNHYRGELEFDQAKTYYNRALGIRLDQGDSAGLVFSYQVIGNLHGSQDNNDLAKANFQKSLRFLKSGAKPRTRAALLTNIGVTYFKEERYDSARYYYVQALEVQKALGNQYSQTLILNNISALLHEQEKYVEANEFALEGAEIAKEIGARSLLSSLYYNISDNYKALGEYKESFEYYQKSDSIDAELLNEQKNAQMNELEIQFETEKKDKELALQDVALLKGASQRNTLIWLLSGLLLISIFVYNALTRKRRANRLLSTQKRLVEKREKEKALLLRELHHRVKNNFQIVSSLLNLQYYNSNDGETAQAIKSGQARVEAMSMIHRELYQGENMVSIEMEDYIRHLIQNTAYSYDYAEEELDLELLIDEDPLSAKYAIPLGVIINELITNSFKHAFAAVERPMLRVSLKMNALKEAVTLVLSDNGPGLPKRESGSKSSFGLELIEDLVKQLKGQIQIESTKFSISFPYKPPEFYVES